MRRIAVALALLAGLILGALGAGAVQRTPGDGSAGLDLPPEPTEAVALPPAGDDVLLAWTPDRLPPALVSAVTGGIPGVEAVTVVRSGRADLVGSSTADGVSAAPPPPGLAIPVEVMVFDRRSFPGFTPAALQAAFAQLGAGNALVGATSARLRGVGAGGTLELAGGGTYRVAAVVDDGSIGGAEVAVAADDTTFPSFPPRYLLLRHAVGREEAEAAIRSIVGTAVALRFRSTSETPFLRNGDAVLPPVLVKEQFGEFAYGLAEGRAIVQDVAWQRDRLVDVTLPLLGRIRCHRNLVPPLRRAMEELELRALAGSVVSSAGDGCWNPRLTEEHGGISRHAWGAAIDLNVAKNPTGVASVQDPRLVEVLEACGFTWGGRWLEPDPAHFEYLSPPAPGAC